MDRRTFIRSGIAATSALAFGSRFWHALASHAHPVPGPGPYGALGAADANGISLPAGFTSRQVARSADLVPGTSYRWHFKPDGGATFATDDGGWIYVCNSEVGNRAGGAGAIRFASDGTIVDAYSILERTHDNCAGGSTPWGTWLSCEERDSGLVYECDPLGIHTAVPRPNLGTFQHEAAVVDPVTRAVFLTEDRSDGRLYRFTPELALDVDVDHPFPSPILETGVLEVAEVLDPGGVVAGGSAIAWHRVPMPVTVGAVVQELPVPTRHQVAASTAFNRGEGMWFDEVARTVYFSTTGDHRIWEYNVDTATLEVLFDGTVDVASPLRSPDNLTVAPSGDVFVCEDADNLEIVLISPEGQVAPFLRLSPGLVHSGSELAGAAFDPSGTRLYFSSQRAYGSGATYEVSGPFRTQRVTP